VSRSGGGSFPVVFQFSNAKCNSDLERTWLYCALGIVIDAATTVYCEEKAEGMRFSIRQRVVETLLAITYYMLI
jgi:hypothetical protein